MFMTAEVSARIVVKRGPPWVPRKVSVSGPALAAPPAPDIPPPDIPAPPDAAPAVPAPPIPPLLPVPGSDSAQEGRSVVAASSFKMDRREVMGNALSEA